MKKILKLLFTAAPAVFLLLCCTAKAFALTEAEVQAQVDAVGKEAVTGNVLIWFLCAIAFLKVSRNHFQYWRRFPRKDTISGDQKSKYN